MNKIRMPIIHDNGFKYVDVEIDVIVSNVFDKMEAMMHDNYKPKTLVIWEGYFSALSGVVERYGRELNPLEPTNKIQNLFGLDVIITQKEDVIEVY